VVAREYTVVPLGELYICVVSIFYSVHGVNGPTSMGIGCTAPAIFELGTITLIVPQLSAVVNCKTVHNIKVVTH